MACPSFSLSLLFVPLGAVLCLLRLLGFQCNIHAPADFLKLGNLGAGLFQRVIFRFPLCFEVSIFLFHSAIGKVFVPFGRFCMEIAVCRVP